MEDERAGVPRLALFTSGYYPLVERASDMRETSPFLEDIDPQRIPRARTTWMSERSGQASTTGSGSLRRTLWKANSASAVQMQAKAASFARSKSSPYTTTASRN